MPLHIQVDESSQDAGLDVNPVYVQELGREIPRYLLPEHGVPPRTALQIVRDELILDGNARLNLATFVTYPAARDRLATASFRRLARAPVLCTWPFKTPPMGRVTASHQGFSVSGPERLSDGPRRPIGSTLVQPLGGGCEDPGSRWSEAPFRQPGASGLHGVSLRALRQGLPSWLAHPRRRAGHPRSTNLCCPRH